MFWKRCSGNISERTIWKSYFKGAKQSYLKMMGCRKKFVEVQEEVAFYYLQHAFYTTHHQLFGKARSNDSTFLLFAAHVFYVCTLSFEKHDLIHSTRHFYNLQHIFSIYAPSIF